MLTAMSFLGHARGLTRSGQHAQASALIKAYVALGRAQEASDIAIDFGLAQAMPADLSEAERQAILAGYRKTKNQLIAKTDHGHELLLAYLAKHASDLAQTAQRPLVLVEIGTTRENVPGQGSTEKIARFCLEHGIVFITVDMDPHNTAMAEALFRSLGGAGLTAVHEKGEDFLEHYQGALDFLFLDAYDFDHGNHSALRQSRYQKYLGKPISDADCHQMHLSCAQAARKKLSPWGLICIDDTWLEAGDWKAKGTLAMPYLLGQGFRLMEARNRAALLAPPKGELQ